MSDGNRSKLTEFVTVAFIAAVFILYTWAVWDISASKTENAVDAGRYSAEHAEDAQEAIRRECTTPATMAECVTKIMQTAQEHQRAEHDLSAQKDMAHWALWMMVITGLSALVTAIGIYFVRENLLAVREANAGARTALAIAERGNEISSAAMVAQTRPWIEILDVGVESYEVKEKLIHIDIEVKIKNVGHSPAHKVEFHGAMRVKDPGKLPGAVIKEYCDDIRGHEFPTDHTLFPQRDEGIAQGIGLGMEAVEEARKDDFERRRIMYQDKPHLLEKLKKIPWPVHLYLIESLRYRTHGSPIVHQTAFMFDMLIRGDAPNHYKTLPMQVGSYDASQIELVNTGVGVFTD